MTAAIGTRPMTPERRKVLGSVYTPPGLVRHTLTRAGLDAVVLADTGAILDPACGDGAFLVPVVELIAAKHRRLGSRLSDQHEVRLFLDEIETRVHGVDIDPVAVALARQAVRTAASEAIDAKVPPDFMSASIIEGDFLLDHRVDRQLSSLSVVAAVGNPPYVAVDSIDAETRSRLKSAFVTAFGRLDLYALFVEKCAGLVEPHGVVGLVLPESWLTSRSTRKLRTWLNDVGHLESVDVFDSHYVFQSAALIPAISVWRKPGRWSESSQRMTHVAHCSFRGGLVGVGESRTVPTDTLLTASPVRVSRRRSADSLLEAIRADHPTLESRAVRISAGPATGLNRAFVLEGDDARHVDPELVHPYVRGRDIRQNSIEQNGKALLLPYAFEGDSASMVDLRTFPRTWKHLRAYRAGLEQRHCVRTWGKDWYDVHDPVPAQLLRTPKILLPDVSKGARFALDPEGAYVPSHSAYYVVPEGIDPRVLCAVLNSAPVELVLRTTATRAKDGFSRFRRQFLAPLPVPNMSDEDAQTICALFDEDPREATDFAEQLFDADLGQVRDALAELAGDSEIR